jgi:cytosine/adenosine deaminase-related metal-dependent hydrolase
MAQATLIRGGTVVTAEEERRADVLVVGEAIAAVGEDLDAPAGCATIDAGGAYVMPGTWNCPSWAPRAPTTSSPAPRARRRAARRRSSTS